MTVCAIGGAATYQIAVQGNLDPGCLTGFGSFDVAAVAGNETRLSGTVADQAALHGILRQIQDLGLPLLSVVRKDVYHLLNDSLAGAPPVELSER